MTFQSYSQAGQDRFAWEKNGRKTIGTFLDIGCGHPTAYNNSYGLELIGWTGLCVDIHEEPNFRQVRPKTELVIGDALHLHWPIILGTVFSERVIDYLSIDCDELSFDVLTRLPWDIYKFRTITIEHDFYLRGPSLREEERRYLWLLGYVLSVPDVLFEGKPYEDWWMKPELLLYDTDSIAYHPSP